MYDLPYHKERDEQAVWKFIDRHPFAFLSGCDSEGRPVATQVPVFMEERNGRLLLRGHVMKDTDHYSAFFQNENVLVVFSGNHTYVSGTWYSDPNTPSTWNYMSVHVKGTIRLLEGEAVEKVLRKTSLHFESGNRESPTVFDNLPDEFKRMAVRALAAFEIKVTEIDSVFKLSQDRDVESYLNIMDKLKGQGEDSRVIAADARDRAVWHAGAESSSGPKSLGMRSPVRENEMSPPHTGRVNHEEATVDFFIGAGHARGLRFRGRGPAR